MNEDTETDTKTEDPPKEHKTALYAEHKDEIVLRPHVYDGIQEYDQKLPNWWLFTFYIMIVWFVIFWVAYYQFDFFRSPEEKIAVAMDQVKVTKDAELNALLKELDDRSLVTKWAGSPIAVSNGETTFKQLCVVCHDHDLDGIDTTGPEPRPLQGLSLKDRQWKFGNRPMQVFTIINDGSPAESKGHNGARMVPWGQVLPPKSIAELTAYVLHQNKEEFAPFGE